MAEEKKPTGDLPDGVVMGIIGFLLGVTLLLWTATGIAGLLAHGHWPAGVHFTHTPQAMRALVGQPHDVAAAWPAAPPGRLPGPGLLWGVVIGQLMVLLVLAVWVMNIVARLRAPGRAARRRPAAVDLTKEPEEPGPQPAGRAPLPAPRGRTPGAAAKADGGADGLDAWFRTVPRAAPFVRDEAPTTEFPAVPIGQTPTPAQAQARAQAQPPASAQASASASAQTPAPRAAAPSYVDAIADGGEVVRTYALFAGPRGDKAKRIVQPAVLAAAGPVVVTTADQDTYHQTVGNRAKLGPVLVYDPTHALDVPGRLRWAPHGGCERPGTAAIRAAALLAPLRTERADEAIVHEAAVTMLRCWLHAAAVDGRPFRQVHRWSSGMAGEAVRILRTNAAAASGWSGELESVLHAHSERRDAAQSLIRRTLQPLNEVHIRDACNPPRNGRLDLESWAAEQGTLYIVGERIEDPRSHLGAMPLLTALLSSVVEHGRRMAAASSAGRLDPPLTFVLDDVAALAPAPDLPALLLAGHAAGLPSLAVFRSAEQALARWHAPLWQQADVRVALGDDTADALLPSVPDALRIR